jgi:hypothetical protein
LRRSYVLIETLPKNPQPKRIQQSASAVRRLLYTSQQLDICLQQLRKITPVGVCGQSDLAVVGKEAVKVKCFCFM